MFPLKAEAVLGVGAAEKARVVPVDDFVREELYPGYKQAFGSQPFVAGPVRPFSKADNASYWLRDSLHFSEGMVPASIALLDDAQTWGAQLGAEIVGVPPTRGSINRLAGTPGDQQDVGRGRGRPPPAGQRLTSYPERPGFHTAAEV